MSSGKKLSLALRAVFLMGGLATLLLAGFLVWIDLVAPLNRYFPIPSPDAKFFAYFDPERTESGKFNLVVSMPRGRQVARFATNPGAILWSIAGHLAIVDEIRNQATLAANAEGRFLVLTQLGLREGTVPRWSRDGTKLAYVRPASHGDEVALYDMQQPEAVPIPLKPELSLHDPHVLFWSPGSQELFFLNTEGSGIFLVVVNIPSGKTRALAQGSEDWKNPESGPLRMSPDGTKIYLPPPRNSVIDAGTGETLWTLPSEASALWVPWSADGRALYYSRQGGLAEIVAHDFSSQTDLVVLQRAFSGGFFTVDGRSYFFRATGTRPSAGVWAGLVGGQRSASAWHQVDVLTQIAQPLVRREVFPWEQTQDGWILAKQEDFLRVRFGLYEPTSRLFSEYVFPTAREDASRHFKSRIPLLLNVVLYALLGIAVFVKRPESPPARAFCLLSLVLTLTLASAGEFTSGIAAAKAALNVKAAGAERLGWLPSDSFSEFFAARGFFHLLCWALLPPALLCFATVFPERNELLLRRKFLWPFLYGSAFSPLATLIVQPAAAVGSARMRSILLVLHLAVAWPVAVGSLLAGLVYCTRHPADRRARDQVRWAVTGLALPFVGFVISLSIVASVRWVSRAFGEDGGGSAATAAASLLCVFGLFLPVAIAHALVARKLYNVQLFLRRAARYALLGLCVSIVYLPIVAALTGLVGGSLAHPWMPVVLISTLITALLGFAIRGRLQSWLDRSFDRREYELREIVGNLAWELPRVRSRQVLAARLAETVEKAFGARTFALFVLDRTAGKLRLESPQDRPVGENGEIIFDPAEPLCRYFLEDRRPFEVEVSPYDPRLIPLFQSAADRLGKLEAALLVGLERGGDLVGLMVLGAKASDEFYDAEELELLSVIAGHAAVAVENAGLFEEVGPAHDIVEPHEVHPQALLAAAPAVAGCDIAARFLPARSASADYYDFVKLPGGRIGLAISHVSGKGLTASPSVAELGRLLRAEASTTGSPSELTNRVNRQLYSSTRGASFCVFFYGIYDSATRRLEFINAGHTPPLVWSEGKARFLESTGVPLGLYPQVTHEPRAANLNPGALLILYSEGVIASRNAQGDVYGVERLVSLVSREKDRKAADLADRILADVHDFSGGMPVEVDQTVVLLKVNPA